MIEHLVFVFAGALLASTGATIAGFFLGIRYSAKGWIDVIGQLNEHYAEQLMLVLKMPIHMADPGEDEPCPDCGVYHDDEDDEPAPEGESN